MIRPTATRHLPWLPQCAALLAAAPIALNWSAIRFERHDQQVEAEREARETLLGLPARAVMLAEGDNDTYPLWYMQQVRGMRPDVTVVTVPLLGPAWYREEIARRYALLDSTVAERWRGIPATLENLRAHARAQHRPVVRSPIAARVEAGTLDHPE